MFTCTWFSFFLYLTINCSGLSRHYWAKLMTLPEDKEAKQIHRLPLRTQLCSKKARSKYSGEEFTVDRCSLKTANSAGEGSPWLSFSFLWVCNSAVGIEIWVMLLLLLRNRALFGPRPQLHRQVRYTREFSECLILSLTPNQAFRTPAQFRRLKQEDHDFEASLDYTGNYRPS